MFEVKGMSFGLVGAHLDQVPPANPHNRRTGPAEEEEEDLVDKLIRNTGCEKEHYLVQV